MLNCGIVGLPLCGKTTVFNVITKAGAEVKPYASGKTDPNRAVVSVPDRRFDKLVEVYQPKREVPAQVEFVDLAGLSKDASKGAGLGNAFLSFVGESDALVHVIRCFDNPEVPHPEGDVDPARDWEIVEMELIFRDLSVIENRLNRLNSKKKLQAEEEKEKDLLERCRKFLLEERPLRDMEMTKEEIKLLKGFAFLTVKPELVVLNLDETQVDESSIPGMEAFKKLAADRNLQVVKLFGRMEMDLLDLDEEEQKEFMADLEIEEPGRERLISAAYRLLGLISFFTVGKDEVKAWTIRENSTAVEAAGAIHTDLARGFIRAQVVHYDDFEANDFSMAKCREKGLLRLEGKEYIVKDGDIIEIRFNV
ncbi:GTP-binding protein YchF [Thermovirga lienii DSM 17291]|uniref:Ribosome-binding ATPase YchF n=1 Tax=Thermovirga lienii (strain ATCC BAA-1197 / DSM 17291 / Cas60314) TaxID=580340 RepID=G7V7D7_THELD|nr:redox-regulated ATPase YchF [Thermovirga lienii]AER67253.1 GTP-binding protein YchF [Thermovirga lienii DSM 17291]